MAGSTNFPGGFGSFKPDSDIDARRKEMYRQIIPNEPEAPLRHIVLVPPPRQSVRESAAAGKPTIRAASQPPPGLGAREVVFEKSIVRCGGTLESEHDSSAHYLKPPVHPNPTPATPLSASAIQAAVRSFPKSRHEGQDSAYRPQRAIREPVTSDQS